MQIFLEGRVCSSSSSVSARTEAPQKVSHSVLDVGWGGAKVRGGAKAQSGPEEPGF